MAGLDEKKNLELRSFAADGQARSSTVPSMQDILSNSPARNAVLNTTELLENILRHLDLKTLLLAQRVSLTFKIVIGCKELQRKLFFIPATFNQMMALQMVESKNGRRGRMNYTVIRLDPASGSANHWAYRHACERDAEFETHAALNTLLIKADRTCRGRAEFRVHSLLQRESRPGKADVEPSWKRMLLSQPPPSFLHCTDIPLPPGPAKGSSTFSQIWTSFANEHDRVRFRMWVFSAIEFFGCKMSFTEFRRMEAREIAKRQGHGGELE